MKNGLPRKVIGVIRFCIECPFWHPYENDDGVTEWGCKRAARGEMKYGMHTDCPLPNALPDDTDAKEKK